MTRHVRNPRVVGAAVIRTEATRPLRASARAAIEVMP
jgi:hypothetical protein